MINQIEHNNCCRKQIGTVAFISTPVLFHLVSVIVLRLQLTFIGEGSYIQEEIRAICVSLIMPVVVFLFYRTRDNTKMYMFFLCVILLMEAFFIYILLCREAL